MIHHISIAVNYPLHVAQVLAELWQGQAIPFPDHEGSFVALALDAYGTMIEVHPRDVELVPGADEAGVQHLTTAASSTYSAVHFAVSVPISEAQIQAIADREGWRTVRCHRANYFDVIEFWVENHQLIELLPPEIAAGYLAFMQPQALQQVLAAAS